jgi:hypothetical protein
MFRYCKRRPFIKFPPSNIVLIVRKIKYLIGEISSMNGRYKMLVKRPQDMTPFEKPLKSSAIYLYWLIDWLILMKWDYVSELLKLTDILLIPRWYMSMENDGGMILTGENTRTQRKTCPSATLSTTNPRWIDPGANLGPEGKRPAPNRLSHFTACKTRFRNHM